VRKDPADSVVRELLYTVHEDLARRFDLDLYAFGLGPGDRWFIARQHDPRPEAKVAAGPGPAPLAVQLEASQHRPRDATERIEPACHLDLYLEFLKNAMKFEECRG